MCEAVTIGLLVGGAAIKAYSEYKQGQADASAAEVNARNAAKRAAYAEQIGGSEAGAIRSEGSRVIAEQKVAMASNGVDITQGSAPNLFASTRAAAELDAQKAKANAALEAWGHRQDAAVSEWQAASARQRSVLGPLGTIVGAGADVGAYKARAARSQVGRG